MTEGADWMEDANRYLAQTYARLPICLVRGEGSFVWDQSGKRYLDLVMGIGVNGLGHCHPRVVAAICEQASRLLHVSNLYHIEPQIRLAKALCQISFADRAFFCNSGGEANEACIKLARKYAKDSGHPERYEILTMEGSFHGRTLGSLAATAQTKYHKGFEPLPDGFRYVPYNDLKAAEAAVGPKTAAIMLEPIQALGGVNVPSDDYLSGLRRLCDEKGLLLILDEVFTGIGRTGAMFCHQHAGVEPDVMALAKALAGGLPVGALLAKEKVAQSFGPGTHAATFGGNPLVAFVGCEVLKVIEEENLVVHAREMGDYFLGRLRGLQEKHPFIREVRGRGLLIGVELEFPGKEIDLRCQERGLLINSLGDKVLRIIPPLNVKREEIDFAVAVLDEVFEGTSR
ncbi:MAG: aspartate aminotransferase family protein [candidate division NC10 bacterium]|nr:aspartate aminotransferase family protein [candidate division NC10 bacterium]